MRKLCLMLVSEINRLGGAVMHCSFSKLVLSTQRNDFASAQAFISTLCDSLRQKRAFQTLSLAPRFYASSMLWIDVSNYAYIKCYDCVTNTEMLDVSDACQRLDSATNAASEQKGTR